MLTVAFGESNISRTQVQLWYKPFKEGQKDANDDTRNSITSTSDENIEAVKKMIWDNRWITIGWHIVRLMPNNFYWYFRHETCDNEDCSKIAKLWAKTTSHGRHSRDVDNVQRRFKYKIK